MLARYVAWTKGQEAQQPKRTCFRSMLFVFVSGARGPFVALAVKSACLTSMAGNSKVVSGLAVVMGISAGEYQGE